MNVDAIHMFSQGDFNYQDQSYILALIVSFPFLTTMPSFSIWKILSLLFMLRYSVASGFDSHDGASAFSFSVSPPDDGSSGNPIVAPPTGDSYSTGESQGSLIGAGCQDDAYQIPNGKRGIRRRGKSCPANFNVQDPAKDQGTTSPNGQQQPDSGTGEQQITPSPFNQKSTDTVPSLPAPPQSNQKMCHDPSLSIPLCSLAVNAINVPLGSPYFTLPICSPRM